jgi:hypothetical protein
VTRWPPSVGACRGWPSRSSTRSTGLEFVDKNSLTGTCEEIDECTHTVIVTYALILYSAGMSTLPAPPPLPRLASIDRSQLLLHTLDVERLIDDDHSARSIWHLARHTVLALDGEPAPELFIRGSGLYSANLNAENPLGTMQSIEHTLRALDKLAEQEQ